MKRQCAVLALVCCLAGCTSITYQEGQTTVTVRRVFSRASVQALELDASADGRRRVVLTGYASNAETELIKAAVSAAVKAAAAAP